MTDESITSPSIRSMIRFQNAHSQMLFQINDAHDFISDDSIEYFANSIALIELLSNALLDFNIYMHELIDDDSPYLPSLIDQNIDAYAPELIEFLSAHSLIDFD